MPQSSPSPWERLRAPFPPERIGKLPRRTQSGTVHLDFVSHAWVTDRLLEVDPQWSWEPIAWTPEGLPRIVFREGQAVLWIKLTVCDVTKIGVGMEAADAHDLEKQLISDALRNAAMRFGVALDCWAKETPEQHQGHQSGQTKQTRPQTDQGRVCAVCDEHILAGQPVVKQNNAFVHKNAADCAAAMRPEEPENQREAYARGVEKAREAMANAQPAYADDEEPF